MRKARQRRLRPPRPERRRLSNRSCGLPNACAVRRRRQWPPNLALVLELVPVASSLPIPEYRCKVTKGFGVVGSPPNAGAALIRDVSERLFLGLNLGVLVYKERMACAPFWVDASALAKDAVIGRPGSQTSGGWHGRPELADTGQAACNSTEIADCRQSDVAIAARRLKPSTASYRPLGPPRFSRLASFYRTWPALAFHQLCAIY